CPARHALEPRHASFADREFIALARRYGVAIVYADSDEYPAVRAITADFVYARLMRAQSSIATGYNAAALDAFAKMAKTLASGGEPAEFPRVSESTAKVGARNVFMFFINGAKERAPAAAGELLKRLG
ncbi:MAG TPA: DUF72 domain-containing protein, partial [Burkholderiales bacterium]|nr:DUF72 domain-containing protein [Burkholderiales bacterium]